MTSRKDIKERYLRKKKYKEQKKLIKKGLLPKRDKERQYESNKIKNELIEVTYFSTGECKSDIIDVHKDLRRKIGSTFNYHGVKLIVVEQFNINKCKYCYFGKFNCCINGEVVDCSKARDISITGTCIHAVLFKEYKPNKLM